MPRPIDPIRPPEQMPLLANPLCLACSRLMRLSRISPHAKNDNVEVRAYECLCGREIQQVVPLG